MKELDTTNKPNMQLTDTTSANPKKEFALILLAASALVLGLAGIIVYAILTQPKTVSETVKQGIQKVTETSPSAETKNVGTTEPPAVSGSTEVKDLEKEVNDTSVNNLDKDFTDLEKDLTGL
jgi:hypothetical protein